MLLYVHKAGLAFQQGADPIKFLLMVSKEKVKCNLMTSGFHNISLEVTYTFAN